MKNDLKDIKLEYHQKELSIDALAESPYLQFMNWMDEAIENNISYPNNAVISTCSQAGVLSSRVILLKGISEKGILFFTNYDSAKGQDIAAHPQVALNIFWKEMDRQVRLRAKASKTDRQTSKNYFDSRSLESRISAIASPQSQPITKEELQHKFKQISDQEKIECPLNWGGYKLEILEAEFWQGRPNRLHDRFNYKLNRGSWIIERLAP